MGLIKAGIKAVSGTLSDQWKDYFYCEALPADVLVVKGKKKGGSGSDNIITDGSGIAVADGQCMIIVEQGQVVEVCAEPGEFVYDMSSEPSIFAGDLKEAISGTIKSIKERFSYGGFAGKDQRIYYFNMKEMPDNKFGTATPIPFRVVDKNIGLDLDVSIRCHGVYSYRIVDPLLFYTNVCGNVERAYTRSLLEGQMKSEFISAMQPAFAKIASLQIRPNEIPGRVDELCRFLNEVLSAKWRELRGIAVVSVAINSVTLPPEDEQMIKQAQRTAILQNPGMAAATLTEATADAMKKAASNSAGAMTGFMGMNMASQGGMNAQELYVMAGKQKNDEATWTCPCGAKNTGKFCTECGREKPSAKKGWTCSCGAVNLGKFCSECGKPKPQGEPLYRCDKCGWEPADPHHPPKFCPECGDPFDEQDIEK